MQPEGGFPLHLTDEEILILGEALEPLLDISPIAMDLYRRLEPELMRVNGEPEEGF